MPVKNISNEDTVLLESYGLLDAVSTKKHREAFRKFTQEVFDHVLDMKRTRFRLKPSTVTRVPTFEECLPLMNSGLDNQVLWRKILKKHVSNVPASLTTKMQKAMAQHLLCKYYSSIANICPVHRSINSR